MCRGFPGKIISIDENKSSAKTISISLIDDIHRGRGLPRDYPRSKETDSRAIATNVSGNIPRIKVATAAMVVARVADREN